MDLAPVDPRDDDAFARWFAVTAAVDRDIRPDQPGLLHTERRAFALDALRPDADQRVLLVLATEGGEMAGAGALELSLGDNTHLAEVHVAVLPSARRRGVGTALLRHLERLAVEDGRTASDAAVDEPPEVAGRSAGRAFAQRHGYAHVLTEVRRDIPLPVPAELASRLHTECAPYAEGFSVLTWRERCPDHLLDDLAVLLHRMSTDAPSGGADWREEVWDGQRVRRREELAAAQGRVVHAAGAVHDASGRLVAFTEVGLPLEAPERAYQWETLVLAEHRGHRLGLRVKLACYAALAEDSPATQYVSTWNAEENTPMIRVNDALGAVTNGAQTFWERPLSR